MTDKDNGLIEKLESSELIYDGRVVHLYKDSVTLPNGQSSKREVIRHVGAVALVPIDSDGKVVLVRQYRHATGKVLLEIPAGTLNKNEVPEVCAIRELQEETGYKPGKLQKIGGIYTAPGYTSEFIHLYLATDLVASELEKDEDEFIEVIRVTLDEAIELIANGEIADGKSVSGLLLARDVLSGKK
jgi:ADP-ribose pyrophosphatase